MINGTETTYFVGAHYEVTGGVVTKYYYAGAQRIAVRTGTTLSYLLSDHLGSTSLTTDAAGNVVSELRYKAWGEVRYASGATPTDYTYTGQYSYASDFGLMFYNARWYDPYLNHFTQPDTIVPNPYNSQSYDRYAYANNNPLKYVDPDGHDPILLLIALIGATIFFSQIPSDQRQADPANWGDPGVQLFGGLMMLPQLLMGSCANDGDCTNEAQAAGQALKSVNQDGDPLNEINATAESAKSVTDKLSRYLLNPEHVDGSSKAEWFKQALGYTKENMADLAKQIVFNPETAKATELTEYGQKYEQVINIIGANGKSIDVVFVWIRNADGVVRLVTSIPTKK